MTTENIPISVTGRPRCQAMTDSILGSVLELVEEFGFDGVTVDRISQRTGASRAAIYRRWTNVPAIIMEAFLAEIEPLAPFKPRENVVETFRSAMKLLIQVFNGRLGVILSALLGRVQTNPQLLDAFRSQWVERRRKIAYEIIREAIADGQLRPDVEPAILTDALYGPIYYRLLVSYAPLTDDYIDALVDYAFSGATSKELKKSDSSSK